MSTRYCGIVVGPERHHLCVLEEMRLDEPPLRLAASFFEPGPAVRVAAQVLSMEDVVVAVGGPPGPPLPQREERSADAALRALGVQPQPLGDAGVRLWERLATLGAYEPDADPGGGLVREGDYREAAAFETNPEAVFCALQGRRIPARRHPLGVQRRIEELLEEQVVDTGGDLWHRRIEEIEAAAAAVCAHRYAVGHAWWVGDPEEGVVVLPGSTVPHEPFATEGVLPEVERLRLPQGGER